MVANFRGKSKRITAVLVSAGIFGSMWMAPVNSSTKVHAAEQALTQENFDQIANGTLPAGWKLVQGVAKVVDGKLVLSSPSSGAPARVVIPLGNQTGNYVFEADMTFQSAVEDTRWASLMYRIQPNSYPYYQFAIRRGTTSLNGLEFAIRNENNQWVVPETNFYPENMVFNKSYHIKVIASGNRVQQFIDGQLVVDTDQAGTWASGDVGFQASGTTVQFDNVKVNAYSNALPPLGKTNAFLPQEAKTNIVNPPTIISDTVAQEGASSVLLQAKRNEQGQWTVDGAPIEKALENIKGKFIPVIQVEEHADIEVLANIMKVTQTQDFQILSSNPAIVKEMRGFIKTARGALLYNKASFNKNDIAAFARDIHKSDAMVAVIPQKNLSPDAVHYLHSRAISVWGSGAEDVQAAHTIIHLGVDGIVTDNPLASIEALGHYPENTLVQRPVVAAHRGVPSIAPENTMASYRKAYELGADMIETDVQRTKDGKLVIMHDSKVDRTTNGTGYVKDLTLEQIRGLDAGIKFSPEFAGEKVPTFAEYLNEFNGKDVVLLVELKADGIEKQVMQEIEQAGMIDNVVIQSFNANHIRNTRSLNQEVGTGYLYSSGSPSTTDSRLKKALQMMQYGASMNATLNADYGSLNPEFIQYMRQRGFLNMHWTFRNENPFGEALQAGVVGPITDYTQWLTDAPIRLEIPNKKVNLNVGKSAMIQVKSKVNYRESKTENIQTTLFVNSGETKVKIEGNTIQAIEPGTVNVFAMHTFQMLGKEWHLVAEPIEVTVTE
ncbi:glycerophosphodiester phosphodiesterase family protein [Neobacillus niacini]|uniref:glycerophosphodiester phosphodiesterase family protein n=1 Tax=Neobacillus niacini TaxID=86668 RepID=UPI0005EEA729|nr:glycerophosphodiester phosphodiesterase family protein [Neobacillus niacini]